MQIPTDEQSSFYAYIENRRKSGSSLADSYYHAQNVAGISNLALGNKGNALEKLLLVSEQVLKQVEDEGEKLASRGLEPAYHNRQHFADALLALSFFLTKTTQFSAQDKQLMLLTILVHDFGHRGLAYIDPYETSHEEESVRLLKDTAINTLDKSQQELINRLILGTNPKYLSQINARYINDPENKEFFMQSLINDADITASFIPNLSQDLTKLILIELGNPNPNIHQIDQAYLAFKSQFSITTPIAKSLLFS